MSHRVLLKASVYDRAKVIADQMHLTVPAVLAAALDYYDNVRTANHVKATTVARSGIYEQEVSDDEREELLRLG